MTTRILSEAKEKGYLYSRGPASQQEKLEEAWRRDCFESQTPYIVAFKRFIQQPKRLVAWFLMELTNPWWLSCRLLNTLKREFEPEVEVYHQGNTVILRYVPNKEFEQVGKRLLKCVGENKPRMDESFDLPLPLVRGNAVCLYADALEEDLTEGHTYYIREIPNMRGHVVVLGPGGPPLVGIHLDRFDYGSLQ